MLFPLTYIRKHLVDWEKIVAVFKKIYLFIALLSLFQEIIPQEPNPILLFSVPGTACSSLMNISSFASTVRPWIKKASRGREEVIQQ